MRWHMPSIFYTGRRIQLDKEDADLIAYLEVMRLQGRLDADDHENLLRINRLVTAAKQDSEKTKLQKIESLIAGKSYISVGNYKGA